MKKLISIILALTIIIGVCPIVSFASESPSTDVSEQYKQLVSEYDESKSFIDSIIISSDDDTITIDGAETSVNDRDDLIIENRDDEIMLSAPVLCEYIDAELEDDFGSYDAITYEDRTIVFSADSAAYDVSEDYNDDISVFETVPYEKDGVVMLPATEIAESLGYEVVKEDDELLLTRPYQSCRLLVSTSKKNIDTLNAVESIRDEDNDITILQFENETDAIEAEKYYDSLKFVEAVETDCIVTTCEDAYPEEIEDDGTVSENAFFLETEDDHFDSTASEWIHIDDMNDYLSEYEDINDVIVAVVDTGVCSTHEKLKDRVICAPVNFSDSGDPNSSEDDKGHGTHVTGIVVSNTLDNVTVLDVKVLNGDGQGTLYQVYEGIEYAVSQGAKVINLSLGMYGKSELLEKRVKKLWNKNITVVASAGNSSWFAFDFTPAGIKECITVSAIEVLANGESKRTSFSNWGKPVDIEAPGVNINSTYIYDEENDGYKTLSGTSMSAPFVSAVAGMLYSYDSSYTAEYVHNIIRDTGQKGPHSQSILSDVYLVDAIDCRNLIDIDRTEVPITNIKAGYYNDNLLVELSCDEPNAEIYYTTDNTRAYRENGTRYTEPILVDKITRIHAVAYSEGKYKSFQVVFDYYLAMIPSDDNFTIDETGTITAYKYNETYSSYIQIPETINGITVTAIGDNVFKNNSDLLIVILPNTCKSIGDYSFYWCGNLKVFRGDGVTSVGKYAFYRCNDMFDLTLPSLERIGIYSFYSCKSLTSFSNDLITEIPRWALFELRGASVIDLPNVTKVGERGISNCRNCQFFNLPKLETIGQRAFAQNVSVEHLSFPNATTVLSNAFEDCKKLQTIDLSSLESKLSDYVFNGDENLFEAKCPNITSVGIEAFNHCAKLRVVDFENVEYVGNSAFSGCINLKYFKLDKAKTVNSIGAGFDTLYLPECEVFAVSPGSSKLRYVYLPKCKSFEGYFSCENLEKVYMPSLERVEGINKTYALFENCTKLKEIDLPLLSYIYSSRTLYFLEDITKPFALRYVNVPLFSEEQLAELMVYRHPQTSKRVPMKANLYTIGKFEDEANDGSLNNESDLFELSVSSTEPFTVFFIDTSAQSSLIDGKYQFAANVNSGDYVTLYSDSDSFEAVVDKNNRVKSTKSTYTFRMEDNSSFFIKNKEQGCVSFYNANGDLISTKITNSFNESDYPSVPDYYGHNFVDWSLNANEINEALAAGESVRVDAIFEKKMVYYSVTLYGGTIVETDSDKENGEDSYREFSLVTVEPIYTDTTKFVCWKDIDGNVLSYNEKYTFYVSSDIVIYAEYSDDEIQKEALTRITNAVIDKDNGKITFIAEREVPEDCKVISHGIIMTNDSNLNSDTFIIGADNVLKGTSVTTGNAGTYTLYKSNVTTGDTWYARSYVIYSDKNDNIYTKYSEIYSATME